MSKIMKKTIRAALGLFCMAASLSSAVLVDDFEGYELGDVATVTGGMWNTTGTGTIVSDGTNQYLKAGNGGSGYAYTRRIGGLPFNVTEQATVSFDIYCESDVVDQAFGLTDNSAMTWYDQYGPYCRIISDGIADNGLVELSVRDGGVFIDDLVYLNLNQLYTISLVIDTAGGDALKGGFDLYLDGALIRSGNDFRKAYANPLTTFTVSVAQPDTVRVDNINLIPEPATLILLGLGGLGLIRRKC
jgi:hypothetical protein